MKNLLYALGGAIIGSAATWFITKKIYEDELRRQAEEIHDYYESNKVLVITGPQEQVTNPEPEVPKKPSIDDVYSKIIKDYTKKEPMKQTAKTFGPYVISQEEAGKDDDKGEKYELLPTWEHYANEVLVDARDHVMTDEEIDHYVGLDYADHFGKMDDSDYLYIRNEELHLDIEIHNNGIVYKEYE